MINKIIKNRKGQTQQVFIYIMVIIVVGFVLLFGYKSINKLINQSCDVDLATFQADLKSTLEKHNGYGDIAQLSLKVPCSYEKICFINSSTQGVNTVALKAVSETMAQEVEAGTGNNVFLIKGTETTPLYGLDYLNVPGNSAAKGFICIDAKGETFHVSLEGLGKGRINVSQGV